MREVEALIDAFIPFHVARLKAGAKQRLEVHPVFAGRPDVAGKGGENFLQAACDVARRIQRRLHAALRRDEDELGRHRREFGVRIERVPHDLSVVPRDVQNVHQTGCPAVVGLRRSGLTESAAEHPAELRAGRRLLQARCLSDAEARVEHLRVRIVEQQSGMPFLDVIDEILHLRRGER